MRAILNTSRDTHLLKKNYVQLRSSSSGRKDVFHESTNLSSVLQRSPACSCGGGCPRCMQMQTKSSFGIPTERYRRAEDQEHGGIELATETEWDPCTRDYSACLYYCNYVYKTKVANCKINHQTKEDIDDCIFWADAWKFACDGFCKYGYDHCIDGQYYF